MLRQTDTSKAANGQKVIYEKGRITLMRLLENQAMDEGIKKGLSEAGGNKGKQVYRKRSTGIQTDRKWVKKLQLLLVRGRIAGRREWALLIYHRPGVRWSGGRPPTRKIGYKTVALELGASGS